jgi:hypothetical protein
MKNLEWKEMCSNDYREYARSCSSACLLKNAIYVFGGCDFQYEEINDFIKFPLPYYHLRGHFTPSNFNLFPQNVRISIIHVLLFRKYSILKNIPKFVLFIIFGFLV